MRKVETEEKRLPGIVFRYHRYQISGFGNHVTTRLPPPLPFAFYKGHASAARRQLPGAPSLARFYSATMVTSQLSELVAAVGSTYSLILLDEAASKLVGDVNADGDINYTDILRWNVYLHRDLYRGDAAALQQLDAAITLGLPPAEIQHQVLVMLGEYTPPPEPGLLDFVKLKLGQNLQQP